MGFLYIFFFENIARKISGHRAADFSAHAKIDIHRVYLYKRVYSMERSFAGYKLLERPQCHVTWSCRSSLHIYTMTPRKTAKNFRMESTSRSCNSFFCCTKWLCRIIKWDLKEEFTTGKFKHKIWYFRNVRSCNFRCKFRLFFSYLSKNHVCFVYRNEFEIKIGRNIEKNVDNLCTRIKDWNESSKITMHCLNS